MQAIDYLWLIPALPLAGAAVNGVLAYRQAPKPAVTAVALGAPLASLLVAAACIWQYLAGGLYPRAVEQVSYAWTPGTVDGLHINVAFLLDPLAVVMLFIVTFVGFLIHVYSVGYMGHDEGYARYFAYLNLFMAAMLTLVLGNNYLVMFFGWEGVGLCSYLLIGFYYDQEVPPYAGKKACIVNRIGDCAFLIGMFALVARFGTLDFMPIFHRLATEPRLGMASYAGGLSFAAFVGLCFFIGAIGKSAHIPLYVWRPDAGVGADPRRHHGDGRRLHGSALERDLSADARSVAVRGDLRHRHGAARRHHRHGTERHQEGARLLDGVSARLHVHGGGRRRLPRGAVPRPDPRLLQGAALPRLRIGDPCHGRRAGHAEDGRPEEAPAGDLSHVRRRLAGARRHPGLRRRL